MKLDELQREAQTLSPDDQKKLLGFLVSLEIRRDKGLSQRLGERLDDRDPSNWVSLKDAERELKSNGL